MKKFDLHIEAFPDTMSTSGAWIATVNTIDTPHRGYYVKGDSEKDVLEDLFENFAEYLLKLED